MTMSALICMLKLIYHINTDTFSSEMYVLVWSCVCMCVWGDTEEETLWVHRGIRWQTPDTNMLSRLTRVRTPAMSGYRRVYVYVKKKDGAKVTHMVYNDLIFHSFTTKQWQGYKQKDVWTPFLLETEEKDKENTEVRHSLPFLFALLAQVQLFVLSFRSSTKPSSPFPPLCRHEGCPGKMHLLSDIHKYK